MPLKRHNDHMFVPIIVYPHQPQICRVANAVTKDMRKYCALVTSPDIAKGVLEERAHI